MLPNSVVFCFLFISCCCFVYSIIYTNSKLQHIVFLLFLSEFPGICFWMRPIKQNTRKLKTEEVETDEEDELRALEGDGFVF